MNGSAKINGNNSGSGRIPVDKTNNNLGNEPVMLCSWLFCAGGKHMEMGGSEVVVWE